MERHYTMSIPTSSRNSNSNGVPRIWSNRFWLSPRYLILLILLCFFQLSVIMKLLERNSISMLPDMLSAMMDYNDIDVDVNNLNILSGSSLTIFTVLRDARPSLSDWPALMNGDPEFAELLTSVNAVRSWMALHDDVFIILFGNDDMCDFFDSFVLNERGRCLPVPCFHPDYDVPTYDCLFESAALETKTEYLMYSNSDMVYFPDLLIAIEKLNEEQFENFLMVGARNDLEYSEWIDFDERSPRKNSIFENYAHREAVLHGPYGIDYFAMRTRFTPVLPPFLVGRIRWDNWLIAEAVRDPACACVDVSKVVFAVHLNHGVIGTSHYRRGTDVNEKLSATNQSPVQMGLNDADFFIEPMDKMYGSCPLCSIRRVSQRVEVVLYKQATSDHNIFFTSVNHGSVDFAVNWVCSVRALGINNFFLHTSDRVIEQRLKDQNIPTVFYASKRSPLRNRAQIPLNLSTSSLLTELTISLAELLNTILVRGYNVIYIDVMSVIMANPLLTLDSGFDFEIDPDQSGCFIAIRASEGGLRMWNSVLSNLRHASLAEEKKERTGNKGGVIISNVLRHVNEYGLAWRLAPSNLFSKISQFSKENEKFNISIVFNDISSSSQTKRLTALVDHGMFFVKKSWFSDRQLLCV